MKRDINSFLASSEIELERKLAKGLDKLIGHNGPYRDQETGVRSLAHLISFFSNRDFYSASYKNKDRVTTLVKEILNSEFRKSYEVFIQRRKPGKDEVNGVIGLAWVIEALSCAYRAYGKNNVKQFLLNIEAKIDFNVDRGIWYRPVLKSDKYYRTLDETFNHQLWLAYALAFKSKVLNECISSDLQIFFKKLGENFNIHQDGLIYHENIKKYSLSAKIKSTVKSLRDMIRMSLDGTTKKYKENGYHLFNMYAFARLKDEGFGDLFEKSSDFKKALGYCVSSKLSEALLTNKEESDFFGLSWKSNLPYNRYGIPYNLCGFEFLYIKEVFSLGEEGYFDGVVEAQFTLYSFMNSQNKSVTEDEANLLLRTYELTFLRRSNN